MDNLGTLLRKHWPILPSILIAMWLFRGWYVTAGYLTFGDFGPGRWQLDPSESFHIWDYAWQLGRADSTYFWLRYFHALAAHAHLGYPITERVLFFYLTPPLLIVGMYVLALELTGNPLAAGVSALCLILGPDFLVRAIGGHEVALGGLSAAPWSLYGAVRAIRTGRVGWFAFTALTFVYGTVFDVRWTLPTLIATGLFSAALALESRARWFRAVALCLFAVTGVVVPNLPWILAHLAGGNSVPLPPASHYDTIWIGRLSFANAWDALAGWNPTIASDFSQGILRFAHAPVFGLLFAALVALCALRLRTWIAMAALVAYIVFAFLFKGSNPPLGSLYSWLFVHLPLFNLYREPVKFGGTVSLCAAVVLAYGISSFRTPWKSAVMAGLSAAAVIGLSYSVLAAGPGGTLQSRSMPERYRVVDRYFRQDDRFGRILWLPDVSRWLVSSALHPFVDGVEIGYADFEPFSAGDVLGYVQSPLFPWLLRAGAFRYVAVDTDTQNDSTFRSASFRLPDILAALKAVSDLQPVKHIGSVIVYRVTGESPAVWSSRVGLRASGHPSGLAAPALLGLLPKGVPVALNPGKSPIAFGGQVSLNGASGRDSASTADARAVVADSVDEGTRKGVPWVSQLGVDRGSWTTRISLGVSTLPLDPVAAIARPALAGTIASFRGAFLGPGRPPGFMTRLPLIGRDVRVPEIPIVLGPAIRFKGDASGPPVTFVAQFFDSRTHRSYYTVGPTFEHLLPATALDVRTSLFETLVESEPALLRADHFDDLLLQRIALIQAGGAPRSLGMRIDLAGSRGTLATDATALEPSNYSCARCIRSAGSLELIFSGRARNPKSWSGHAAVIYPRGNPPLTAFVTKDSRLFLEGITVLGTGFRYRKSAIANIEDAPDVVPITLLSRVRLTRGDLVLRVRGAHPTLRFRLVLFVRDGRAGEFVQDVPCLPLLSECAAEVSLDKALFDAGSGSVRGIVLLAIRRDYKKPIIDRITSVDSYLVNDGAAHLLPKAWMESKGGISTIMTDRIVTSGGETIVTSFGAPSGILAVGVAHGGALAVRSKAQPLIPGREELSFTDRSGNQWLVLAERYDPQWQLLDAYGRGIGRHFVSYGLFNSWYIAGGLSGTYRLTYTGEAVARFGTVLALALSATLLILSLSLARRRIRIQPNAPQGLAND